MIFVHKYKYSHYEKRKKFKKLYLKGLIKFKYNVKNGWIYSNKKIVKEKLWRL